MIDVGDYIGGIKFPAQTTPINRTWSASFIGYPDAVAADYIVWDAGTVHHAPRPDERRHGSRDIPERQLGRGSAGG